MNILPPNNDGNISIKPSISPVIQNNRSFNLSKRKSPLKSVSTDTTKVDEEKKHIHDLSKRLPELTSIFNLHHKIGEGSFSSVFLASLKCHEHLPQDQRKFYAIKHLVPTSHPSRIEQELRCLKYIGGCENVVGLDFCMRKYDTVIFVMPYLPHTKFSEYVLKMDVLETKTYIKNLLLALRRVHQFHIIHRDVKPSNFLYDRINRRFLLVDFGLAQKIDQVQPTNGVDHKTINIENASIDNISDNKNGYAYFEQNNSQNVNARKRKFIELNEEQTAIGEEERNPKKALIVQNDLFTDSTPLKPLQGDHPKITPSVSVLQPIRSQDITPKLAAVKRQVFINDNENTSKRMTPTPSDRIANVRLFTDSVQSLDVNSFSNNCASSATNISNYKYLLQNTYQLSNYPVYTNALELQKLAQYYNYYNALNYNSFLANSPYVDGSSLGSHKSMHNGIDYNLYRSQLNSHLLQNNLTNYNNMYACHSKISQFNNGMYLGGQNQVQSAVSPQIKVQKPKQVPLDLLNSAQVSVKHEALSKNGSKKSGSMKLCGCGGRPSVCSICLGRGAYNAPRAGTQGFRPPEVLLKYTEQTTAVDLWACGVILLSVVSGCYPFFRAPDDLTALAEMVTLFGSRPLKNVANVLGRHLMCSHTRRPLDLRKLCSHLRYRALKTNSAGNSELVKTTIFELQQDKVPIETNPKPPVGNSKHYARKCGTQGKNAKGGKKLKNCQDCSLPHASCVCAPEINQFSASGPSSNTNWCGFPDEAFDLLERLLDLNPHTRITASEALLHPFLSDS